MGDNFGLNDSYQYFEFELDSLDATSSFQQGVASTDWPFFEVAAKGPLEDVAAIKILEVQIPVSWYVFNTANNTFLLQEQGHSAVTVTLPIGNYSASQLAPIMASALTSVSPSSFTYTVAYNSITQKYTFYNNNISASAPFTFTFGAGYGIPGVQPNSGNKNPRLYIGFPPGSTVSQTYSSSSPGGGFVGDALLSPNAQLTSGPNYVYLNSAKLGSDVDVFLPRGAFNLGGGAAGPQITKIPVTENSNGVIYWSDPDPQKWFKYDQLQSINAMDFYLTLGNTTTQVPLQLNGLSFSLKLGILRRMKTVVDHGYGKAINGRVYQREGPKRIRGAF